MALKIEDAYAKWDKGITHIIRKSGVPQGDIEDVKQQIYLEFIRGQVFGWCPKCQKDHICNNDTYDEFIGINKQRVVAGEELAQLAFLCRDCSKTGIKVVLENVRRISYAEIFDETKGAESTFIFNFVSRRCMQFISKTYRDPLRLTNRGRDEDGESLDLLDIIPAPVDIPKEVDLTIAIRSLRERLDGIPIRSIIEDLNVERSLRKVFEYMEKGYKQRQIANRLNYSEASISLMVKEIRKMAVSLGLEELVENE